MSNTRIDSSTASVNVATTRKNEGPAANAGPSPFRAVLAGGTNALLTGAEVATGVLGGPVLAAAVREAKADVVSGIAGTPGGAAAAPPAPRRPRWPTPGSEMAAMHAMQQGEPGVQPADARPAGEGLGRRTARSPPSRPWPRPRTTPRGRLINKIRLIARAGRRHPRVVTTGDDHGEDQPNGSRRSAGTDGGFSQADGVDAKRPGARALPTSWTSPPPPVGPPPLPARGRSPALSSARLPWSPTSPPT